MLIYILNLCTIVGVDICALDGGAKNQRHLCDIPHSAWWWDFCILALLLAFAWFRIFLPSVFEMIKLPPSLNFQIKHCSLLVSVWWQGNSSLTFFFFSFENTIGTRYHIGKDIKVESQEGPPRVQWLISSRTVFPKTVVYLFANR